MTQNNKILSDAIRKGEVDLSIIPRNYRLELLKFNFETLKEIEKTAPFMSKIVSSMLSNFKTTCSHGYLTVMHKVVKKGETFRTKNPHIDGNFIEDASYLIEKNGIDGWYFSNQPSLTKEQHDLSYNNENGGIILASDGSLCKGWFGEFDGEPAVRGDCSHIELRNEFMLKANSVYYGNSRFIHESTVAKQTTWRRFVRITCGYDNIYHP